MFAHPASGFVLEFGLGGLGLGGWNSGMLVSLFLEVVQNGSFGEVDAVGVVARAGHLHKVADFALEADIGDEALAGLDIDARKVAGIRVAVGIGVLDIEEVDEVVAVGHGVWFSGLGLRGFCGFFFGEEIFLLVIVAENKLALLNERVGFLSSRKVPLNLSEKLVELNFSPWI